MDELVEGVFDFCVRCGDMAKQTVPGQFLLFDCGDGINMLMRRPISICDVIGDTVRFILEVKGSGTAFLAEKKVGDYLDILGPLGEGFIVSDKHVKPAVIGGGIGIFPLLMLSKKLTRPKVYLGFRDKGRVFMEEEFSEVAESVEIATDDGSYGYNGYAVDLLEQDILANTVDIIYACGPKAMLVCVQALAKKHGVKCQLSLEERMGCGIGACLTCVCKTTSKGTNEYKRVCKNGPVFWSDEVILDD